MVFCSPELMERFWGTKNLLGDAEVFFEALVNAHSQSTEHDCNQPIAYVSVLYELGASRLVADPPVLVPTMRSK